MQENQGNQEHQASQIGVLNLVLKDFFTWKILKSF